MTYPGSNLTSDRNLRQRMVLKEYGVDIEHIPGINNTVIDDISPLPINTQDNHEDTFYVPKILVFLPSRKINREKYF